MMEIKAGVQSGTKYKLKGKGLKVLNSSRHGDEYVIIDVIVPTKLSREQKKLFESLNDTDLEESSFFREYRKNL